MAVERENRFSSAKEMREALSEAAAMRRPVEEEAKYLLWLAQQDKLKTEQDRLNNEPQALETQPQQPENQSAGTNPLVAVGTQNSSEFTRQSYLAEILPEPPKPEPPKEEKSVQTLPAANKNAAAAPPKNRKNLWLLPVAALLLLTLGGGIFGMWWILRSNANETAKPTPTATPESVGETTTEQSPLPSSTFDSSVVVPTQTPKVPTPASQTPNSTSTTKPPVVSTPAPAVSTPTPKLSTPTPKPPEPRTPTPRPQTGCPQPPPRGCRQLPNCVLEC
jgi:hypothetical protein